MKVGAGRRGGGRRRCREKGNNDMKKVEGRARSISKLVMWEYNKGELDRPRPSTLTGFERCSKEMM